MCLEEVCAWIGVFALDIFITWFLLSRDQWSETNRIYSSDCQQQADSCKVNDSVFSANQFWDRITSLTWKLTSSAVVWEIEWVRTSYFTNDRKLETNRGICIGHLLAQLANVSPGRLCRNSIWLNFIPKSYFRHRRDRDSCWYNVLYNWSAQHKTWTRYPVQDVIHTLLFSDSELARVTQFY